MSKTTFKCEVRSLRHGGYLKVAAGLNWGYSFAGVALLGTDAREALGYLEQATELTDLDALQQKLDGLAVDFLQGLAQEWIGEALANDTVQQFIQVVKEVVDTYNNIDQRIIEIYESYLGKVPELTGILDKLDQVTSREGFANLSESKA